MGKRRSYLLPCTAEAFIGPESVRCKVSNTSMQAEEMSTAGNVCIVGANGYGILYKE